MDRAMKQLEKGVKRRLILVCVVLACGLSALSARLVYLQVAEHEKYSQAAVEHYRYREELPASRGQILDRNGDTLARNLTVYTVVADPNHLRDVNFAAVKGVAKQKGMRERAVRQNFPDEEIISSYYAHISDKLSELLRIPPGELNRTLKGKKHGDIILARDIEEDIAQEFREVMEENSIRGIYLRRSERRVYPSPLTLTHVIGFVQEVEKNNDRGRPVIELVGREGIEKVYDEKMTGTPGWRDIERDNRKNEIHAFRGEEQLPVAGKNVRLTIDMGLQTKLEEILQEAYTTLKPEKISSVWMDPHTGEVLAMASRPHFDLASRKGSRRNIAVSDMYEPGSTFKIVAASGALNEGIVTPNTEIFCYNGLYDKEGFELRDHAYYGDLSVEKILVKSSNIGAYLLGRQLNRQPFYNYMEAFGFGQPTGIELTGEIGGVIHPVSRWNQSSFSRMTMGYAVGVTPLQIATAYCAVANGGELLQPHIVKSVEDERGRAIERSQRTVVRRVISERTSRQMRVALSKVTGEGGTGTNAAIPGYDVCGKTGTAQKNIPGKGYAKGRYVVSFAGFFPADDPQVVGLVVVDDPHAEGVSLFGGTIAAPIWKEIALQVARIRAIPPKNAEVHRLAEMTKDDVLFEVSD
ncbi:MAG: penicillin-binding protein 2 [Verrucomicrobiae bacterium]|nr:penicillin-binding protein 2 [Verrucomicrobiae bacterium]